MTWILPFCPNCRASRCDNIKNPSFKSEKEFASQNMTDSSRRLINHSLHRKFSILLQFLPKHYSHTQKKTEQDEIIRGNFLGKHLIKVISQWTRFQESWFLLQLNNFFQTIHSAFLQNLSPEQLNLEGQWMLQFRKCLTHCCTKMSQSERSYFVKEKLWKSAEFYYLETGLYPSNTDIVEAMNTLNKGKHHYS